MTLPIGAAPGQWGDPVGYTVTAADMFERIDEPLDELYGLTRRAQGTCATLTSDDTPVPSGGSAPTQINLIPTSRGLGETWTNVAGRLRVPAPGIYLLNVHIVSTNIAVGFSGRTFVDAIGGAEDVQRQPVAVGTEDGGATLSVTKTVPRLNPGEVYPANGANLLGIMFYHTSGGSRTVRLTGSLTRLVDL